MTLAIDYLHKDKESSIGLHVAIQDFTRSWLRHTKEPMLVCHATDQLSHQHFYAMAQEAGIDTDNRCGILNPLETPERLHKIDCLFVPDPDLSTPLWRRAKVKAKHALCGLVHSMSGEQVTRVVADLCTGPTHSTDALICPSLAIKDAVEKVWEIQSEYLAHKFKTPVNCPVQTPVIPIGIDTKAFEDKVTPAKREEQRSKLGCDQDEVVILFLGRLNFATKAHPLPLLQAVEEAAKQTQKKIRLLFYGYYMPQAEMEKRFTALLEDFAPKNVTCEVIQNSDERFPDGVLAAADIFTSLADNIQESFGLTPIEAMACGLPTVITDWDGYRDGVRNGIDGFLIPTYTPPTNTGLDIAEHYMSNSSYGHYLMGAAQSTIIDIQAAAEAFLTLIENDQKRAEMGAAGKKRAQEEYDWQAIIPAYEKLWHDLGQEAGKNTELDNLPPNWEAIAPSYPNPFKVFDSFPTEKLTPETKITMSMQNEDILKVMSHDMNYFIPSLLAPRPLIMTLIEAIRAHGHVAISDILSIAPPSEHERLWRTIAWFLKHGICRKIA